MPSQRKRIGFLPSEEVHDIIDKICKANKYSQSKVTGILVEEALRSRGLLKNLFPNMIKETNFKLNYETNNNLSSGSESLEDQNYSSMNTNNRNKDLKMINEFIEYKFFKRVMNKNNNIFDL